MHALSIPPGAYAPSPSATPLPKGVCEVKLLKDPVKGLGFRISDHMLSGDGVVRVYDVVKGGPAHIDGKLRKGTHESVCNWQTLVHRWFHSVALGDVLLSVNGQLLKGMGHKEVAEVLKNASNIVTLTVQGVSMQISCPPPPRSLIIACSLLSSPQWLDRPNPPHLCTLSLLCQ